MLNSTSSSEGMLLFDFLPLAPLPPVVFYVHLTLMMYGAGMACVFILGTRLGEGILPGVLSICFYLVNWYRAARIWFQPPLRENHGMALLMVQLMLLQRLLARQPVRGSYRLHYALLGTTEFCFMAVWQFSHFALLTQSFALYLLGVMNVIPPKLLRNVQLSYLLVLCASGILQFGNTMVLNSLLLHCSVAVLTAHAAVDWLVPNRLLKIPISLFATGATGIALRLTGSHLLAVFGLSPEDDSHIFSILRSVMNGEMHTSPDFHVRMYLSQAVFLPLTRDWYANFTRTLLLPTLAVVVLVLLVRIILPNLAPTSFVPALMQPLVSRETTSATASVQTTGTVAPEGIAAPARSANSARAVASADPAGVTLNDRAVISHLVDHFAEEADLLYFAVQSCAFCLMSAMMQRLVVFSVPVACVLAAQICNARVYHGLLPAYTAQSAAAARLSALFSAKVRACMLVLLIAAVLQQGKDDVANAIKEPVLRINKPDLEHQVNLAEWVRRETPRNASFTSDMTTTSLIMLGGHRAITLHPQYESKKVRDRTESAYTMYGRRIPPEVCAVMTNLSSSHLVLHRQHCTGRFGSNERVTDMVDHGLDESKLGPPFCQTIWSAVKHFELQYWNAKYSVWRVCTGPNDDCRPPTSYPARAAVSDMHAVKNLCDLAEFYELEMGRYKDAKSIYDFVLAGTAEHLVPSLCFYNYALLLDEKLELNEAADKMYTNALSRDDAHGNWHGSYAVFLQQIMKQNTKAGKHFKLAIEKDPTNAYSRCGYAMFLAQIENNKKSAREHLLEARRLDPQEKCVQDSMNVPWAK